MKKTKFLRQLTAFMLTLSMALPFSVGKLQYATAAENNETPSQAYVEAMGKGWNLYNTYDADNTNPGAVSDETSWGQPVVTKDQIIGVKNKGFKSIRIPMTAQTRYTEVDGHYVIDSAWLAKYKQTVDWAVEEGLYVMINLHHDNGWLSEWNGDKSAEEYKRFVDLWTQLAAYFKDEPNQVCFETINEPYFNDEYKKDANGNCLDADGNITTDNNKKIVTISKQDKMNMINQAGYDVIRKSGGNNGTRMIIIPCLSTNPDDGRGTATYNFITAQNDQNIIATVHNYSDWVFSSNIGIQSFDEPLYGDNRTARTQVENFYDTLTNTFTSKGIGVIIGEYGLLSESAGITGNQLGERLKFYELMNSLATQKKICLMLWAGVVDRYKTGPTDYEGDPSVAQTVVAAINGQRSSYSIGFNENYVQKPDTVKIPLTLNGNKFIGIDGLTNGKEYTYDEATATVTLSKDFVSSKFYSLAPGKYGEIAELVMKFDNGADWHQHLIKYATTVLKPVTGTTTSGITIPVDYNGAKLRRATATDESGKSVAPWSWWKYVPFGDSTFSFDNATKITLGPDFFNGDGMKNFNGKATVHFEFYDGQVIDYVLTKDGTNVTGKSTAIVVINTVPTAKITADNSNVIIERDQSASFTVSMNQLTSANAFDITLKYDSSLYNVSKIEYLVPGLTEVSKSDKDGNLRLIFGKTDKTTITAADYTNLVRVTLAPKSVNAKQVASVQLVNANTATINNDGVATDAASTLGQSAGSATIRSIKLGSDINQDGNVTLSDLSIALAHFMDDSNSTNWVDAQRNDIDGDGVVNIVDLQLIAGYIK